MPPALRILHLEDNPADADLIRSMLEADGVVCEVTRVDTRAGYEASLERGGFDLILTDYTLPAFDGFSALELALQKCPEVPFIFVSGTLGEEVAIEALKVGATDYILKHRPSRMVPAVHRALREAKERGERKRAEALLSGEKRVLEMIAAGTSLAAVLDALCRLVEQLAADSLASILLLDPDGVHLRHGAAPSLPRSYTDAIDGGTIGPAAGSCGTAAYLRQPVLVSDIATDPLWAEYRDLALPHGLRACWSRPIFSSQEQVLGTFAIYSREPKSPTAQDLNTIEQITHLASIALERKRAEEERQAHLRFLERMDQVNRAIQASGNLEQMMSDVLDALLSIFACDRAWLVHPCDPAARSWKVAMEHTRPEFPGVFALGLELAMDPEIEQVFRIIRASSSAVRFGPGADHPLPAEAAQRFGIQSQIGMAIYPKIGAPYMLGLHQCSYARIWSAEEERLFQEIGRRLEDALTSLLMFRNLRESERKLEEAQALTHVGYWERDPDTDVITWSDETYRIFGLRPQERGLRLAELTALIHPEDTALMARAVALALGGGQRYDVDYRIVRPDGEIRFVHSQGDIVRDHAGRVRRMFGTIQDITERKRAEEALRASERNFQLIVETIPGYVWCGSRSGELEFVNRRILEFTGKTFAEIKDWGCVVHPDDFDWLEKIWLHSVQTGDPFEVEFRFRRRDGAYRWFATRGLPLRGADGAILRWYGLLYDLDDRKRAEDALRKAQAELAHVTRLMTMGELAASIAHEVNQPLSAIATNGSACLHWLTGEPPNLAEAEETARRVIRDANRASQVIARIRALVRKTDPEKIPLDINQVVQEVIVLVRPEAAQRGVALRTELARALAPVLGDRVQLQQVILNLVINGMEAMAAPSETPRELLISSRADEPDGIRISVKDCGIGIPAADLEKLFDAFYTTKPQGMGMGLAISRSIIENHGGRIWAAPNDGPGTTFQFTLQKHG